MHIPLNGVDAASMSEHTGMAVYVLDTGDLRARQACVRLVRVLGLDARLVEQLH